MKSIGLAPNPLKKEAVKLASELVDWLKRFNANVLLLREVAEKIGKPQYAADEDEVAEAELILVLGGDGTMLRWSRLAAPKGGLLMGINFGTYGFITDVNPTDAKCAIEQVLNGDYEISERVVLKATLTRSEKKIGDYYALNDIVVSKGPLARMLALHTFVSGRFMVTYSADGIIVASPTGSTAYSLSAGGPVVHPNISVLIITPICPHTLNARPLVLSDTETIQICGDCGDIDPQMMLTIDGQLGEHLKCSDVVEVGKADFKAKIVQIDPQSFYDKLQKRLRWGERFM